MHSSRIAIALLLGGAVACQNGGPSKATPKTDTAKVPQAAAASDGIAGRLPPDHVVAKWSGGQLTYKELTGKRPQRFTQLQNKYMQDLYQLEQSELEGYVMDMLIEQEAKKAGQTPEVYLEGLAGNDKPTEEEAKAFFDENLGGQGVQFEMVKERILQVLEGKNKQEKVQAELNKVRAAVGVQTTLPPPEAAIAKFDLEGRPSKGAANPKVTIVEFSDFECPYCSRAVPGVDALLEKYKDDVKIYFLHFPLSFHKSAMPAAVATVCAHKQDNFWGMHDKIFEAQSDLTRDRFVTHAKDMKLDVDAFTACLDDASMQKMVEADMAQGTTAGVQGTPSFFVNGIQHQGVPTTDVIERAIKGS